MVTKALDIRNRWALARFELVARNARHERGDEVDAAEVRVLALEESWASSATSDWLGGFNLTLGEQRVLNLLIAVASDVEAQRLCASVSGTVDPTLVALRQLAYGSSSQGFVELSPTSTLRRLRLIERAERAEQTHESRQGWVVSRRVLEVLHGAVDLDPDLRDFAQLEPLREQQELAVTANLRDAIEASMAHVNQLLILKGMKGLGRRSLLVSTAQRFGHSVVTVKADRLSKDVSVMRDQVSAIARECRLLGRIPLICDLEYLTDETGTARLDAVGMDLSAELQGPLLATCGMKQPSLRWARTSIVLEVKQPSFTTRAGLWRQELAQGTEEDAQYLATQYPLAPAMIHHAAKAAKARANGRKLQPEDIYAGIRAVLDDNLGDYAKRVEVSQTWDDIVLPSDQLESINYLIARIRQRRTVYEQWGFAAKVGKGLGTSALFSGPPGTGKTMVAALIAKELGLELYQVDMAKIQSKFIGETERNLAALFDAAEAGHAILLFDEADSLFGKRTEVKSSNDRYANLETNYLLQRLESFTGICLLTSNHESNIDPAFQRRLSLHLRFQLPEVEERAALWQAMLPAAAPVEPGVDFDSLARRFVMSGGYIRNAALCAAFLAADEGSEITAEHLERAARLEYEGMGKIAA